MKNETKSQKFKRLAKLRGDRILRDIHLVGNLSNRNNYEYSDEAVLKLFETIQEELDTAKTRFTMHKKREINL